MTRFEKFLIEKGYGMYILNCKEMKYQKANRHILSTMVNLDHRYDNSIFFKFDLRNV